MLIEYEVNCFDRILFVDVRTAEEAYNSTWLPAAIEHNVQRILDLAYDEWHDQPTPEIADGCCEEHMITRLTEAGYKWNYWMSVEHKDWTFPESEETELSGWLGATGEKDCAD